VAAPLPAAQGKPCGPARPRGPARPPAGPPPAHLLPPGDGTRKDPLGDFFKDRPGYDVVGQASSSEKGEKEDNSRSSWSEYNSWDGDDEANKSCDEAQKEDKSWENKEDKWWKNVDEPNKSWDEAKKEDKPKEACPVDYVQFGCDDQLCAYGPKTCNILDDPMFMPSFASDEYGVTEDPRRFGVQGLMKSRDGSVEVQGFMCPYSGMSGGFGGAAINGMTHHLASVMVGVAIKSGGHIVTVSGSTTDVARVTIDGIVMDKEEKNNYG